MAPPVGFPRLHLHPARLELGELRGLSDRIASMISKPATDLFAITLSEIACPYNYYVHCLYTDIVVLARRVDQIRPLIDTVEDEEERMQLHSSAEGLGQQIHNHIFYLEVADSIMTSIKFYRYVCRMPVASMDVPVASSSTDVSGELRALLQMSHLHEQIKRIKESQGPEDEKMWEALGVLELFERGGGEIDLIRGDGDSSALFWFSSIDELLVRINSVRLHLLRMS